MKYLLLIATALFCYCSVTAQTHITSIKKVEDGLYMMYYDTTHDKRIVTKSTIVEFKNYIVLIEMPISNDGAGATNLKDHTEGGEKVLAALKQQFPNKPLKYVLSTHWHPHSISSVLPFISKGITVVTTEKNFKRLSEFVDSASYARYHQYIRFVKEDGVLLRDKYNEIDAYMLDKADYPAIPTEDFVFYYLPKYNYLHNSCMFQRFSASRVEGKEMISVRVEDLEKLIVAKKITPAALITTDTYWDGANGMVAGDTLQKMMRTGIGMRVLEQKILQIDEATMTSNCDSIIKYVLDNRIPFSILNSAVYTSLRKNDLKKALAVARIQALISPSNPNSWDTFGEVYYFMGNTKMAKRYEQQSKYIDKEFTMGGEETWKKDLEEFQKGWNK